MIYKKNEIELLSDLMSIAGGVGNNDDDIIRTSFSCLSSIYNNINNN